MLHKTTATDDTIFIFPIHGSKKKSIIPFAKLGNFIVIKPNPHDDVIELIDINECTESSLNECKVVQNQVAKDTQDLMRKGMREHKAEQFIGVNQLAHPNTMAIAQTFHKKLDSGLSTSGIVAVSENQITFWQEDQISDHSLSPTLQIQHAYFKNFIDRNNVTSVDKMHVVHIPNSDEIVFGAKIGKSAHVIKLHLKTQATQTINISYFDLFDTMSYVAPNCIAFISAVNGTHGMAYYDLNDGRRKFFPIPDATHLHTSADGRFVLIKSKIDRELISEFPNLPVENPTAWKLNVNYRRLSLYEKKGDVLLFLKRLPGGIQANNVPQIFSNGMVSYNPTNEYRFMDKSCLKADITYHYLSFVETKIENSTEDNNARTYLYSLIKNELDILATKKNLLHSKNGDTDAESFVLNNGKLVVIQRKDIHNLSAESTSSNDHTAEHTIAIFSDAILQKIIADYQTKSQSKRNLPNRLMSKMSEETIPRKINFVMNRLQTFIRSIKANKKDREATYTEAQINQLRAADRCMDCLIWFRKIIDTKQFTFNESVDLLWKEFFDVKNHGSGMKGIRNSFKSLPYQEVFDTVEFCRNLDVKEEHLIRAQVEGAAHAIIKPAGTTNPSVPASPAAEQSQPTHPQMKVTKAPGTSTARPAPSHKSTKTPVTSTARPTPSHKPTKAPVTSTARPASPLYRGLDNFLVTENLRHHAERATPPAPKL